jgi:hypothetical protein
MARNMGHENALYLLGIQSSLSTEVEGQYSFRLELGGDGESDCLSVYHPHHTASFTVLHIRRALAPQLGLALAAQRLASWLLAWNYFIGVLVCGTTCHWDGHFHENESILLVHQWRTCFH